MDPVENWLSRLSPSTAKTARGRISHFGEWLKKTGCGESLEELVTFQRASTGDDRFRVLDLVQKYCLTLTGRQSTKRLAYANLRSFFAHKRARLGPETRPYRLLELRRGEASSSLPRLFLLSAVSSLTDQSFDGP